MNNVRLIFNVTISFMLCACAAERKAREAAELKAKIDAYNTSKQLAWKQVVSKYKQCGELFPTSKVSEVQCSIQAINIYEPYLSEGLKVTLPKYIADSISNAIELDKGTISFQEYNARDLINVSNWEASAKQIDLQISQNQADRDTRYRTALMHWQAQQQAQANANWRASQSQNTHCTTQFGSNNTAYTNCY